MLTHLCSDTSQSPNRDTMELLTTQEALKYLEDILDIPAAEVPNISDKSLSSSTKLSFLEKVLRAFLEKEPFQSITLMSQDVDKRHRPSWDEIKRDILLGRGGLCYWLNAFMYALLSALGFDSSLTYSTYNVGIYSPNNHVIVLLHDVVTPGSLHLVDVGLGFSVPRAISLNFDLESEEFSDSFLVYKFQRESDVEMYMMKRVDQNAAAASSDKTTDVEKKGQHQHIQKDGGESGKNFQDNLHVIKQTLGKEDSQQKNENQRRINDDSDEKTNTSQSDVSNDKQEQDGVTKQFSTLSGVINGASSPKFARSPKFTWERIYVFNPLIALKSLEPFFHCFDECFTDVTRLSTHSSPRAMCWPDGRFLGLVNSNLVQELEPGKLTKTRIVDVIISRKPQLPLPNHSGAKIAGDLASKKIDNGFENTTDKSPNETVANGNGDICNSKISGPETPETPENTNKQNTAETVTRRGGADDAGIKNNTDLEKQVQLSQLEPLVMAYGHYFPQIPTQMVQDALKNWIATGTIFPVPQHLA